MSDWAEVSDDYVLDTPRVREFVAGVRTAIATAGSPEDACEAIRPAVRELLADQDWLPESYREPVPDSGMGGGIGQWLLYRAEDGSLSLFALVVPAGARRRCTTTWRGASSASTAASRTRRSSRATATSSSSPSGGRSGPATSTRCSRRTTTSTV